MTQLSQDNRFLSISDFSLGKDTFLLSRFSGTESISDLYGFDIEVLSQNLNVNPDQVIGKSGSVCIQNEIGRVFHGYVSSFTYGEIQSDGLRLYRMRMVPWLWFLSQTNNHRVFQEKTTKEILSFIFDELGFSDYEFRAAGGKPREYCVQHNESDLHFISRLLEEDGIAYYFQHSADKHQLIFVDQSSAYGPAAESQVEYSKGAAPHAQITHWEQKSQFKKGVWTLNDYNFKEPRKNLGASISSSSKFPNNNKFEHYEYPGYYDFNNGPEAVKIALESEESDRELVFGAGTCSSFGAGAKFTLAKHEAGSQKGDYVLASVTHEASDRSYVAGDKGAASYTNHFVCFRANVKFRPKRSHIKPIMPGPQTAVVVGPEGEEIYIDDDCRIKVQFIWDRKGENNEHSSCFVRVVQTWAGNQWGSSFIPRIGHEVIVNFIDGDPDRPLVTGSVYNGRNKPTYLSKTQSGIKTRSTKGGTPENFNELRFEDKKGSEQVYLHAEKDFDSYVENNQTLTVDNDRTKTIKHDENSSIGNDRNKTVGNNQSESIGKDKSIDVGDNHTENIGKNMSLTVGKNISIDIGDNHTETIAKNMTIGIGKDLRETVDGQYVENVTKEYSLRAKSITLNADDQITFKTGAATIVMKSNGDITISGANINVKGSGNVVLKGSKVTSN